MRSAYFPCLIIDPPSSLKRGRKGGGGYSLIIFPTLSPTRTI